MCNNLAFVFDEVVAQGETALSGSDTFLVGKRTSWPADKNDVTAWGAPTVAQLYSVITAFAPRQDWLTTAGIERIPGIAVVAVVGVFYVALLGVTFWPRERHAKGEFREEDPDDWKETDR